MASGRQRALVVSVLVITAVTLSAQAGQLQDYPTRYYIIRTDMGVDVAREVAVRLTAMAEEYHRRTRGFSNTIYTKRPFYLFSNEQDYYRAGGLRGSGGIFAHNKLMVVAPYGQVPWESVQHEGFHQFADAVINGDIPTWMNEGLAEYFELGIFTGDGFVLGVAPPDRLKALQEGIQAGKFRTFRQIMSLNQKQWNRAISPADYLQAWSMVHFLIHGDDGKYVKAMEAFMADIGGDMPFEQAWVKHFGRDIDGFERAWRQWWLARTVAESKRLYTQAVVQTLTSFLARYELSGQTFESAADFLRRAPKTPLPLNEKVWLPSSMLDEMAKVAPRVGQWSLREAKTGQELTCKTRSGELWVGRYNVREGRVGAVTAVEEMPESQPAVIPAGAKR